MFVSVNTIIKCKRKFQKYLIPINNYIFSYINQKSCYMLNLLENNKFVYLHLGQYFM